MSNFSAANDSTLALPSLADVRAAILGATCSPTRKRDFLSALTRVGSIVGEDLGIIAADLGSLRKRLSSISPANHGISQKTWSTLRSNLAAAVDLSGVRNGFRSRSFPLSCEWKGLLLGRDRTINIGLARFARYASVNGIGPSNVSEAVLDQFVAALRASSLASSSDRIHKQVRRCWQRLCREPDVARLGLTPLAGAARELRRVELSQMPASFQAELTAYLDWLAGKDLFSETARRRALAPSTIKLRRDEILSGLTALREAGEPVNEIRGLRDLIEPARFKSILRQRHEAADSKPNAFNLALGKALVSIGREWVKVTPDELQLLTTPLAKLPRPDSGLTAKNKAMLRQFDDPRMYRELLLLPEVLMAEALTHSVPFRALAVAQTGLAIGILIYAPLRLQNVLNLSFEDTLFLPRHDEGVAKIDLPGHLVKNRMPLAYDLPVRVVNLLRTYRAMVARHHAGRSDGPVFRNPDGSRKTKGAVEGLVKRYLWKRLGVKMTCHQFRHLFANKALEASPGAYALVSQALGHASSQITTRFYAGIDSRRAAAHHTKLIEQRLADAQPSDRLERPSRRR